MQKFSLKISEPLLKSIYSAMFSLTYVKGFSLLRTINVIETAELIVRFSEKIIKDKSIKPFYHINNTNINTDTNTDTNTEVSVDENKDKYSSVIKTSKKSNITKENIGEIMLAQIPNVSITVASHLMNEYKNIPNLIDNLKANNNCLDNIKIASKQGSRKISKNTVQNIKEFLLVY